MTSIVSNNRDVLLDPVGTRVVSHNQSLNTLPLNFVLAVEWMDHSAIQLVISRYGHPWQRAVRRKPSQGVVDLMNQIFCDSFTLGKPYWLIPFSIFFGFFLPIPFWLIHRYSKPGSIISKVAAYINTPIIALYVGYLPYSVNGQWWYVPQDMHGKIRLTTHRSCFVIGLASQWWARKYRPRWFKSKNYLLSAALDGGSQVILFILVCIAPKLPHFTAVDFYHRASPSLVQVVMPLTSLTGEQLSHNLGVKSIVLTAL